MTTPSPSPRSTATGRKPVEITRASERAAGAIWRFLCEGFTEPWLDEIGRLRADGDDFEASLDIWAVALTASLKQQDRAEVASTVLARLQRLQDDDDEPLDDDDGYGTMSF